MTCGIYLLTFNDNNTYIGLSLNIERRFTQHVLKLRNGTHVNKLVQNTYNKVGIPKLSIIIDCLKEELKDAEIDAFDIFKPTLNIAPAGGEFPISIGEDNAQSKYSNDIIKSIIYYVADNLNQPLKEVAKILGIHYSTVKNVCNGQGHKWLAVELPELYAKVISNKGKRVINTIGYKNTVYPTVISPEGIEYKDITNLTAFCNEHSLNRGAFIQLLKGKLTHHHSWKLK